MHSLATTMVFFETFREYRVTILPMDADRKVTKWQRGFNADTFGPNTATETIFVGRGVFMHSTTPHVFDMFAEKASDCVQTADLDALMAHGIYQQTLPVAHIPRLPLPLASSYLYLAYNSSFCMRPKLANLIYTDRKPDTGQLPTTVSAEQILRPWLSQGFGSPKPKSRFGSTWATPPSTAAQIVGLGILLFQLETGRALVYDTSNADSISEARRTARQMLPELDRNMGPSYTAIVQELLDFIGRATATRDDEMREKTCLKQAISALIDLVEAT